MVLSDNLIAKLKNIKVLLTDVDGVLTDGGLYYTDEGLVMKKFNVKDGMGVKRLRDAGIKTGMISTDTSKFMRLRAERLKMDYIYLGSWEKETRMREICDDMNISLSQAAFIGDDVNDLDVLRSCGFAVCPADSVDEVMEIADYISLKKGGEGIFREVAELIIKYGEK